MESVSKSSETVSDCIHFQLRGLDKCSHISLCSMTGENHYLVYEKRFFRDNECDVNDGGSVFWSD